MKDSTTINSLYPDWVMLVTEFLARSKYLLLAVVCIISLNTACTDLSQYDEMSINQALADSLLNVTETWDFEMQIIEEGVRKVSVSSPYARTLHQSGDETRTFMDGPVHVRVRGDDGEASTEVRSDKATYSGRRPKFIFEGDVVVNAKDGRILRTEELHWDQDERTVHTELFVSITTAVDSIAGYGLDGLDDLSTYQINRVTGEFEITRDEPPGENE